MTDNLNLDIEELYRYAQALDEKSCAVMNAATLLHKEVFNVRRRISEARKPLLVTSSHGTFKVELRAGVVLTLERSSEEVHDDSNEGFRMEQITQFDLVEYAKWWGEYPKPGDTIDILLLGYWYRTEANCPRYEVPVSDYRREVEATHKAPTEEQVPSTMKVSTKEYTVILLYPDYMADAYGQETYMTVVTGNTPQGAIHNARMKVVRSTAGSRHDMEERDEEDLFCIACMEGSHPDLS